MTASTAAKAMPARGTAPALIVLGLDDAQRSHASWFTEDQAEGAIAAAKAMGMVSMPVTEPLAALVEELPAGKLFASGKGFVPFCRAELYERLVAHLPKGKRPALKLVASGGSGRAEGSSSKAASPATAKPSYPADWSQIAVGHIVLGSISPDDGWWPCNVVRLIGDDTFELKFCDFEDYANFIRPRSQIGLLNPAPTK